MTRQRDVAGRASLDASGRRAGVFASAGTVLFDGWWVERRWNAPTALEEEVATATWAALGAGSASEVGASGAMAPRYVAWEAGSGATGTLGLEWDGATSASLGLLDPRRRVLGLVVRPDDTATTSLTAIELLCDTSAGVRRLRYDPTIAQVETHGTTISIPLKGDFAESRAARWQLVALDPVGDVAAMLADATMGGGRAALGRIKSIRVLGRELAVGKQFWWSRMPERIYTAGLGEWQLAARWNVDVDAEASPVLPYYMIRHRHLHRNGRFDVVGFSPLDGKRQNAQVQQFSPYGLLVAEGEVEPDGDSQEARRQDACAIYLATSTMNESAHSRNPALGLTGKQYDPEATRSLHAAPRPPGACPAPQS